MTDVVTTYLAVGAVAACVHFLFGRHVPVPALETAYEFAVITLLWPILVLFTDPGFFVERAPGEDEPQ